MTLAFASSVIRRFPVPRCIGLILADRAALPRANDASKIDLIPFVPAQSAFCRNAELLLLCGVPFASLAAVLAIALQAALR